MRIRKIFHKSCLLLAIIVMFLYTSVNIATNRRSEPISLPAMNSNINQCLTEIAKNFDESEDAIQQALKNTSYEVDAQTRLIYILQWTSADNAPFTFMGKGRQSFFHYKCPYTNCFVTDDRKYFGDVTKFDVIAFSGPEVIHMPEEKLPKKRSSHQKYAFASIESAQYYPVCSNRFDGFFNLTWTFKLDSDVRWDYMVIKDKDNKIVGPQKNMNWVSWEDMDPVSGELKEQLNSKTIAAAWFVSNCYTSNKREYFVKILQEELKIYNLTVDVYGGCGPLNCSRANESCFNLIKEKYYFYLSFENSFCEDYVTEKLLTAVKNYAVPIVYGTANYTRFLPEQSYLNATKLGPWNLAVKMNQLIKNPDDYYEYFRWRKYYTYHYKAESVETDIYCQICKTLNDERLMKERKAYQQFRKWWDPPRRC